MKTLITNKFFRTLALLLTLSGGAIAAECTYNADDQITTDTSVDDWCVEKNATGRRVSAYKVGLCTELPYSTNYQNVCEFIYDSATPIILTAEKGVTKSINGIGDFFLTQDKLFTHSVLVLDNESAVKGLSAFTQAQTGSTGTGSYCWSNGRHFDNTESDDRTKFSAECGTLAEADPQWNSRTYAHFADAVDPSIPALKRNFPDWDGGWTNILLDANENAAVWTSAVGFSGTTNTRYWLAGRGIDSGTGITITPSTKSLDIQFKVSWGNSLSYNSRGIWNMSPAGFDLTIAVVE